MIPLKSVTLTGSSDEEEFPRKKTSSRLKQVRDLLNETCSPRRSHGEKKLLVTTFVQERNAILLGFSDGTLVWIFLSLPSCSVDYVYIDNWLTSRIPGNAVDLVYREKEGIFISYPQPKIVTVFFQPPKTGSRSSYRLSARKTLSALDPAKNFKLKYQDSLKIVEVNIDVKSNQRKNERTFFFNGDPQRNLPLAGIYWQSNCSSNLSPWSVPCRPDANLLVYSYQDLQMDLIAFASFQENIMKVSYYFLD